MAFLLVFRNDTYGFIVIVYLSAIIASLNVTKNYTVGVREFRIFVKMVRKITETL
jgi:hypothetical protein